MPDPTDYCAMLDWLRSQYAGLLAGGSTIRIRLADREVQYSQANLDKLEGLILRYETLCAKSQGAAPRRHALRLGAYR